MSVWTWSEAIEPVPPQHRLTLGEGNTPLVASRSIGPKAGLSGLYFKLENLSATGSYKDRFAAVAVSDMLARGQTRCLATSSGNTGAALAAYCAAAGIDCHVALVETAPLEKCRQLLAYGARLQRIRGFGLRPEVTAEVLSTLQEFGAQPATAMQISAYRYSPRGMTGVQTIGLELPSQLASPIDHVFCPAGGCGAAVAIARGFHWLATHRGLARVPRIEIVQPRGNDTIASAMRRGEPTGREIVCTTKISGLQVPNLIDGQLAMAECGATGGTGHLVDDDEIWHVQSRLAREEGIFCEPASAATTAAVLRAVTAGEVDRHAVVVALVTGSGFKDAPSIERMTGAAPIPVVEFEEFRQAVAAPIGN
ncbi:MAG: pyridoxal-phosphate dependent enzyme [Planctomycetaceae bacterium]